MNIKTIIQITKDEQLKRYHIKHENAKGLITSTEGFWVQTEYPIIAVEKRKVCMVKKSMESFPNCAKGIK